MIAQYNNIGSEVLRLQDYAQIILKFSPFISWTDISRASGILKGPVVQKCYWPNGQLIFFLKSTPAVSNLFVKLVLCYMVVCKLLEIDVEMHRDIK